MPFDGNGNYIRVHNWQQDAANGLDIAAPEMDEEDNSIAAAFNNTLTRDGQGKATADFNPSQDNVYNLGTGGTGGVGALRWKSINGTLLSNFLTSANFASFINPQTAVEQSLSITPAYQIYTASPKIDPRRYGAKGDGVTDDTLAMQTALNVAKAANGRVIIPDSFNALCQPLALTFSGNRTNESIAIEGVSPNGSMLTAKNGTAALLNISGSTPTGNPQEVPLILENFGMTGFANTMDVIQLVGVGYFRVSGMFFKGSYYKAINLLSALTGIIDQGSSFDGGVYGVWARADGAGSPPNLLRIDKCVFAGASAYAIDFDQGSELQLTSNDIEENAAAIHIGGAINCASGFGYGKVWIENNWIEANTSGYSVQVDAPTAGQQTNISIRGGHIVNAPSGQALNVAGATKLLIEDCYSPSPGDTWNLTATYGTIRNATVSTLTDTGITYPTYENITTSAGIIRSGRPDTFTATLTGCTSSPTGNQTINLQGDVVSLLFVTPISGTSNTAAATLTGLPSKYWPANDTQGVLVVIDNGSAFAMPCVVAGASGVITLGYGHTFTTSGTKGIQGGTLIYRRT